MELKYGPEDMPDKGLLIADGITWAIAASAFVVILGASASALYTTDYPQIIGYMQVLMLITGLGMILHVLLSHKLPVMFGTSGIFLVGILASAGYSPSVFSTALFISAVLAVITAYTPLCGIVIRLFTPRATAGTLMLIAVALLPSIMKLIFSADTPGTFVGKLIFAIAFMLVLFTASECLKGFLKSTIYLWAIVFGTAAAFLIWGTLPQMSSESVFLYESWAILSPEFSLSVLIPVMICYAAVIANEIGSLVSVSCTVNSVIDEKSTKKTLALTGVINAVSGLFGVIGGVSYSTSNGIIAESRNGSKYPLIIGGAIVFICGLFPQVISLMAGIPLIVLGCIFLHVMSAQFALSMSMVFTLKGKHGREPDIYKNCLITGFPVLITAILSFMPAEYLAEVPLELRPVAANAFVIGIIALMILEHIIFKDRY